AVTDRMAGCVCETRIGGSDFRRFCLTGPPDFFKTRRHYADLNQAEDVSPLGSSPIPDPRNVGIERNPVGMRGRTMNLLIWLERTTLVFFVAAVLTCVGLGLPTTVLGGTNVIYSFAGDEDGEYADTDLAIDKAGNLYGTT